MNRIKRILFFYQGKFSQTNPCVEDGLRENFPEAELRCVDLHGLIKNSSSLLLANIMVAFCYYGKDILLRKRNIDESFFGTKYLFNRVHRIAQEIHEKWRADFSIQTQSIFDCSSPKIPHFVFTDHTYQSRKEYPDYGRYIWASTRSNELISLDKRIYNNAECIFTMGRNVEATLITKYIIPPRKVLCVGAGCNAKRDIFEIGTDIDRYRAKRILFVGVEWERKGGPQLLQAFTKVREIYPQAILTIVGCRPKISQLENVEIVGRVPLSIISQYYASASIFCMPSRLEPFGIVFLEAMAAGLPVIGLRLGAASDFVIEGSTGYLVEPDDIDRLADRIIFLLERPNFCKELGSNGRYFVSTQYTWEKTFSIMVKRINNSLS